MAGEDIPRARVIMSIVQGLFKNQHSYTIKKIVDKFGRKSDTAKSIMEDIYQYMPGVCELDKTKDEWELKLVNTSKVKDVKEKSREFDRQIAESNDGTELLMARTLIKLNEDMLGDKESSIMEEIFREKAGENDFLGDVPFTKRRVKEYVDYSNYKSNLKTFIKASNDKKVCLVSYLLPGADKQEKILFAPKEITGNAGLIYIHGFKGRKGIDKLVDRKEFSLDLQRVDNVEFNEEIKFPKSRLKELREDKDFFGFMATKPFDLEVNFKPHLKTHIMDSEWPGHLYREVIEDGEYQGWINLKLRCGDQTETLKWLLGYGSDVVIISPKKLKDAYIDELILMAKNTDELKKVERDEEKNFKANRKNRLNELKKSGKALRKEQKFSEKKKKASKKKKKASKKKKYTLRRNRPSPKNPSGEGKAPEA
jgi:hypothetical protein